MAIVKKIKLGWLSWVDHVIRMGPFHGLASLPTEPYGLKCWKGWNTSGYNGQRPLAMSTLADEDLTITVYS